MADINYEEMLSQMGLEASDDNLTAIQELYTGKNKTGKTLKTDERMSAGEKIGIIDKVSSSSGDAGTYQSKNNYYYLNDDILPDDLKLPVYSFLSNPDVSGGTEGNPSGKTTQEGNVFTHDTVLFGLTDEEKQKYGADVLRENITEQGWVHPDFQREAGFDDFLRKLPEKKKNIYDVLGESNSLEMTSKDVDIILDKAKQNLSSNDILDVLDQYRLEGESPYVDETPAQETETDTGATDTTVATSQQKVEDIIESLGLGDMLDETARQEAVDYFSTAIDDETLSAYQIRTILQNSPEYQNKIAEEERQSISDEAAATRGELKTDLERGTSRYLKESLAPSLGRQFESLGGKNRASLGAASSRAMRDIGLKREATLSNATLQDAARQEGYQRDDYISQAVNSYNQSMQQWNKMYNEQSQNKQQETQKFWYPIQQSAQRRQNIYQTGENKSSQAWQESMLNQQRKWATEDRDYYGKVQNQQNWFNLLGNVGGTAAGYGIGGGFSSK